MNATVGTSFKIGKAKIEKRLPNDFWSQWIDEKRVQNRLESKTSLEKRVRNRFSEKTPLRNAFKISLKAFLAFESC